MLFIIAPLVITVIGIGVILSIVIRKFPQLAHLDVETLPQEREARKKKEMLFKRVKADGGKFAEQWKRRLKPLRKFWGAFQLQFRIYVGKIERLWHHEQQFKVIEENKKTTVEEHETKLVTLLQEAEQKLLAADYEQAEQLYIAVIKFDSRSALAYRGLGDTYLAQGALKEAKETYEFLLRLTPGDDNVMIKIADIAEQEGDIEKAVALYEQAVTINDGLSSRFYHLAELILKLKQPEVAKEAALQAVELEPKNPKYLDLLLETVILCGDKDLALRAYEELRMVNPNNQKLSSFQERIKSI